MGYKKIMTYYIWHITVLPYKYFAKWLLPFLLSATVFTVSLAMFELARGILVLIAYAWNSCKACTWGYLVRLESWNMVYACIVRPYFVQTVKTLARLRIGAMRRLAWAFAVCKCDVPKSLVLAHVFASLGPELQCPLRVKEDLSTVKPVYNGHSKIDKTKVFATNGSVMKVESITECSLWAFCNTFGLH